MGPADYYAALVFAEAEYLRAVGAPPYPDDLICLWKVTGILVFYNLVGN